MPVGAQTPIPLVLPSRYVTSAAHRPAMSLSTAVDFMADAGFNGMDLSLDMIPMHDDALPCVLSACRRRAAARGLSLPLCHLPFYMPSPDDASAMAAFAAQQRFALRCAADIGIPTAVIHPIVRHESTCSALTWRQENLAYLTPLRELAASLGVTLAIENMVGRSYAEAPGEQVFGSLPAHLLALAEDLDTGLCWDFGHAHLTGLSAAEGLDTLGTRLCALHIHDNDGCSDSHLLPGQGTIDWEEAMAGLAANRYFARGGCLELELKASHLPLSVRPAHAEQARAAARRLLRQLSTYRT